MFELLSRILRALLSTLATRASREAEIFVLRQQLLVLSRKSPARVRLRNVDRLVLVWLYRSVPVAARCDHHRQARDFLRWHRRGFRAYWRWKSWRRVGRPRIDRDVRDLIRQMSRENPSWDAPRIHGELLMLGIEVSESTVGRYMISTGRPRSQGWKTFLYNHAAGIAAIDLFVVRTISFKLLYGLVILRHARRQLVRVAVTDPRGTEGSNSPWGRRRLHRPRTRKTQIIDPTNRSTDSRSATAAAPATLKRSTTANGRSRTCPRASTRSRHEASGALNPGTVSR
jgi:hypothetical protein